jgi:hypothetical protein
VAEQELATAHGRAHDHAIQTARTGQHNTTKARVSATPQHNASPKSQAGLYLAKFTLSTSSPRKKSVTYQHKPSVSARQRRAVRGEEEQ